MNTLKRVAFVRAYVISGNATSAAIEAGYSPRSAKQEGSRLLTFADVQSAIETERARQRNRADLRAEDVINGLRSIAEDESAPHSSRVAAWRNLGLHLGLFEYSAVTESAVAFMKFLGDPDGGKPVIETEARHMELEGSSNG